MDIIFSDLKKSTKHLSHPFVFSSVFLIIGGLLCMLPIGNVSGIKILWENYSPLIINSLIIGFTVHFECRSSKKSITAITAFMICDIAFFCFTEHHFGLLITVLSAFMVSRIFNSVNLVCGYIITLISGLIAGISLGLLYPFINEVIMNISAYFSNKGALFGAFDNFYSIVFGNALSNIFFHNDYTGSMLIENEIVTGVKDIFARDNNVAGELVCKYLSGKFFANIFIPLGVYICIYKKLEKDELNAVTLCLILSVVTGNNSLFYAFVFLFNPFVYMGDVFVIFAGYITAELTDIRCGYLQDGSLLELIMYASRWIYFVLCGIILSVLSYFVTRLLLAKFDIRGTRILPKKVKAIVSALGGEDNIERISGDKLYVKNPNLINILKIDCDIHENEVTMIYDELDVLKDYF